MGYAGTRRTGCGGVSPAAVVRLEGVCLTLLRSQEYTLAHIDEPDNLAGAEKALKKHEDFVSTMEANEDKIDGALQGGQRLVDGSNLYSGKVQDKMGSIRDRCVMVFGRYDFNIALLNKFGNDDI